MKRIAILVVFIALRAKADCDHPQAPPSPPRAPGFAALLAAWQAQGLSIHQAFDGSKNESKPASFSYLKPLYTADIGVKLAEWDPMKNCAQQSLPIGPSVEWHRTNTPKKANSLIARLNVEFIQNQLRTFQPDGTPALGPPDVVLHDVGYSFSLKPGVTHDVLTHTDGAEHLFSFTVVSNKNYYPNAITVNGEGRHLWRYGPSFGAEYYGNKAVFDRTETEQKSADLAFARGRLFFVAWPFNANMEDRNELSADLTYRKRIGGQNLFGNTHYLSVQLTHYADKKHTIGVGVEYDHGRDPNQKFQTLKQGKLTLRFSL
jgi:hypothetical protein